MNYREALDYIGSVNWKGSVPGLERITQLMHLLGDPQNSLRFIHIGGTNGKGSAAAFTSGILKAAGYKTGLFISPFIETFNERIQINNQNISDEELARITAYVRPYADSMEDVPTEFELITAIAFVYFQKKQCDIVVLEVGMGGEFDATNVIQCPVLAVLTAIGLDHMEYLGDTIEKIAKTKSGIIKPGGKAVLYHQSSEIIGVIRKRCSEVGASFYLSEPDRLTLLESDIDHQTFDSEYGELTIRLPAKYQKNNLALVLKCMEVLQESGFHIRAEDIRQGLLDTKWPGRFEVLRKNPVFLTDGAHNPQGMEAAVKSLKALFEDKKLILIMGVLADKDYGSMLDMLMPLAKTVLCVAPDSPRALTPVQLSEEIGKRFPQVEAIPYNHPAEAVKDALSQASEDDVICCIGSLYLIGSIKSILKHIGNGAEYENQ